MPKTNRDGKLRCSCCNAGDLQASKLTVYASKRLKNERLYFCRQCGRCFLCDVSANTQRVYKDLFDYRRFSALLKSSPHLTPKDAESLYLSAYGASEDVSRRSFMSAFAVAKKKDEEERANRVNPAQNILFGDNL